METKKNKKTVNINISLPPPILEDLDAWAAQESRTRSNAIMIIILRYLEELEGYNISGGQRVRPPKK